MLYRVNYFFTFFFHTLIVFLEADSKMMYANTVWRLKGTPDILEGGRRREL